MPDPADRRVPDGDPDDAVFQMFAEPFVMTQGGPHGSSTTAGLYLDSFIGVSDFGTGATARRFAHLLRSVRQRCANVPR